MLMKNVFKNFIFIMMLLSCFQLSAQTPEQPQTGSWWLTPAPGMWPYSYNAKKEWKRICENAITIIRAHNPQAVILVAGFDWAYDLTPIREAPINAANIGYVTHPYFNKRTPPWEPKWEEAFGFAVEKYPVVATEFGGAREKSMRPDQPAYGPLIFKYLESKGISWLVWCFDPEWGPTLISNWQYTLTPAGEYARDLMNKDNHKIIGTTDNR